MKHILPFLFFVLTKNLLLVMPVMAQPGFSYNYNIDNGLPSNHVYAVTTDRHGYLWMATQKGVVRYNGYEFKLFGLAEGLPTDDNWLLFEDKKNRMWVGNSSNELGYIYGDKYFKAYINGSPGAIYPWDMRVFGDGIIFYSQLINGKRYPSICIERHDTITEYDDSLSMFNRFSENLKYSAPGSSDAALMRFYAITYSGEVYVLYKSCVYKFGKDYAGSDLQFKYRLDNTFFEHHISNNINVSIGDYLLNYSNIYHDYFIHILDLRTGKTNEFNIGACTKGEYIDYMTVDINAKVFFVITKSNILEFEYDPQIKLVNNYVVHDRVKNIDVDGIKISALQKQGIWGNALGTTTNGCELMYDYKDHFTELKHPDLKNFVLVGSIPDSVSFWWERSTNTLCAIEAGGHIRYFVLKGVSHIKNISLFSKDTFMINSTKNFYFSYKNGKTRELLNDFLGSAVYETIVEKIGTYFCICYTSLYKVYRKEKGHMFENLYSDRFDAMLYDSVRKDILVYNIGKVVIRHNNNDSMMYKFEPSVFGVKKIEKVAVDNTYGNYFFKGLDKITVYVPEKNKHTEILNNINTAESSILVYHNKLVAYGRFGVAFCKITGQGQVSAPLIYHNIRDSKYKYVYYGDASSGKLFLNTDKGLFQVIIPDDTMFSHNEPDSILSAARFLYNYRDTINNFKSGDTILLGQTMRRVQFDVINPYGNGKIKYSYQFAGDSIWQKLNADELNIPASFLPGKYYTMRLKARDNVWKSNPVLMHFYIKPYWYQTYSGTRIVWGVILVMVMLVLATAVLVTRKIVIDVAKKRTMRLELELKAIYAQINPHFIFNTLNSAMAMAKKSKADDIYNHISKFSSLLRGYIKSSRNKLITIAEEMENLSDYIELQQLRFKNKFEYEIITGPEINPEWIMIPSLLIQPFVENAINHGILPLEENGRLKIEFMYGTGKDEVICIIEDNGIGRKRSKALSEINLQKGESYGDLLIRDLVTIFNKYETMNIEIAYTDKAEPQSGTIVTIRIKNPKHAN